MEDFKSFEYATNDVLGTLGTKCFGGFFECGTKKIQGKILATLILVVPLRKLNKLIQILS